MVPRDGVKQVPQFRALTLPNHPSGRTHALGVQMRRCLTFCPSPSYPERARERAGHAIRCRLQRWA